MYSLPLCEKPGLSSVTPSSLIMARLHDPWSDTVTFTFNPSSSSVSSQSSTRSFKSFELRAFLQKKNPLGCLQSVSKSRVINTNAWLAGSEVLPSWPWLTRQINLPVCGSYARLDFGVISYSIEMHYLSAEVCILRSSISKTSYDIRGPTYRFSRSRVNVRTLSNVNIFLRYQ